MIKYIVSSALIIFSGCASAPPWQNVKYNTGSQAYTIALGEIKRKCGEWAFKEGITIDGVTYYDHESASSAFLDYRVYKRKLGDPPASFSRQYDYMKARRNKCMNRHGWY